MLRGVEKGDFHNHISRGGTIKKYREELGVPLCDKPLKFDGYNGMESWYAANIRKYFDNTAGTSFVFFHFLGYSQLFRIYTLFSFRIFRTESTLIPTALAISAGLIYSEYICMTNSTTPLRSMS